MEKFNLEKYIAQSGFASRTDAKELILNQRVSVNNKTISDLTHRVSDSDFVSVNGIPINLIEKVRLFMFHKPRGYIVTADDPHGRRTIFHLLPKNLPRLISVGRLDFNSDGLLLMTNYGPLARYFELPENQIKRVYELKLFGKWNENNLEYLKKGMKVNGFQYQPIDARILSRKNNQLRIECSLHEGKNRELRKIFTNLGLLVPKLTRISYGGFFLGSLPQGQIIECKKFVVDKILKEAGLI
jgi:23S rRNA pseudouridine2605 synthase